MQPLTPALAKAVGKPEEGGTLVADVLADSPALHAGLKQGDVITAFAGKSIKTPRDLALAVADTAAGKSVSLTVWRDGREKTIDVTIGTQAKERVAANDAESGSGPLGMNLEPLSTESRSALGLNNGVKGVVVAQVIPGSRADESGVQTGDVIVRIGDTPITSPSQAAAKIQQEETAKKEAIPLLVTRNGTTYYLALQLVQG